jgi:hypothetical protein
MIHLLLPSIQRLSSLLCIFLVSNRRMPVLWHAATATSRSQSYAAHRSHCLLLLFLLTHLTLSLTNTTTTTTASSSVANGAISVTAVRIRCGFHAVLALVAPPNTAVQSVGRTQL